MTDARDSRRLRAARRLCEELAPQVGARFSVELWDGSILPFGSDVVSELRIHVAGPGVLGSLLRRPTLANLLRQYATGGFDLRGGDVIDFLEVIREKRTRDGYRQLRKRALLRAAMPLLLAHGSDARAPLAWRGDETGRRGRRDDADFIRFHYDIGNDFYALFLDPTMQYSCAYFTDWEGSLERAQRDKLDHVCRKLRLQPGERLLDIGCGWGGLVCHAAEHYGVKAHGVTLSPEQADLAQRRIAERDLGDRVSVEVRDYRELEGRYDKVASIGMAEHVGLANLPAYFAKVRSLLRDRGLFLNHAITRRAKRSRRAFARIRPEQRLVKKYVFPGSELDHVGHGVECMEANGFEVHDVEGLREHYARTTRLWCQRLSAREAEAARLVGPERTRLWIAYLAGVSFAFQDGSLRIFQTLATRHRAKGTSGLPPTRADLYATVPPAAAPSP